MSILLLATQIGLNGMQLPERLALAGWDVLYAGAPDHLAASSSHVRARYPLPGGPGQIDIAPLRQALAEHAVEAIVPLDEPAALLLQDFLRLADTGAPVWLQTLAGVAARSLGAAQGRLRKPLRQLTAAWARDAGVAMPAQIDHPTLETALAFGAAHGYPLVFKTENSSSGAGVNVLQDARAVHELHARFPMPWLSGAVLQAWVPGPLAMFAAVAHEGRMLAGVAAHQLRTRTASAQSASSVVRLCHDPRLATACEAFVSAHGLSGMHGFDVIIDARDGQAKLIEWNPRPISISHLGHLVGADLCLAWRERPAAPRLPLTEREVALFPYEWRRDPRSPYLHTAFHDVPWSDPPLLAHLMQQDLQFI